MKFYSNFLLVVLVLVLLLLSGCNSQGNEGYTITVYAVKDTGNGSFLRSESPIFTETDIDSVDFIEGEVSSFKIYFNSEYLSKFDSKSIIEEYEKEIHVDGLRIYTGKYWDMFELQINGATQFYGYFPMGMASSFIGLGPHMSHDIDGVTLTMNLLSEDLLGIDVNDEKTLYDVFSDLDLIRE